MKNKIYSVMGLIACVTGCSFTPKYSQPAAPVGAEWPISTSQKDTLTATAAPTARELKWQDFFNNANLQKVIEMALINNRDLRLASLNVERASAVYGIRRNEIMPTVSAIGTASKQRTSDDLLISGEPRTREQYSINLGIISWELDFFGRIRSLKDIALQEYLATEEAKRSAKSLLVSAVASVYLTLGADREGIKLAKDTVSNLQSYYSLIKRLYEIGLASELELRQAQSQVDLAQGNVARYTQQALTDENTLTLLVGSSVPAELLPTDLSTVNPPKDFSPGISSEVLLHRPDILQAENHLKAANANIGAARAALFPRISLTGLIGTASDELSGLFKPGSDTWSFVPQINIPIFDARTRFAVEVSKVDREIVLTQYEKAIQTAFKEVADALAISDTAAKQVSAQESFLNSVEESYRLVNVRHKNGIDSFLNVLDAQRSIYWAQQGLIAVRLSKMVNHVTLYKVLGGGED